MIQLAAYRGKSWVSRAIRVLTYSEYSHTAVRFMCDLEVGTDRGVRKIAAGNVIEAWSGGVRLVKDLSAQHTPGTPVDLFELKQPLTAGEATQMAAFLVQQLGKPYDYVNVMRFVPLARLLAPRPAAGWWTRSHVFCSELAMEAFATAGRPLLERCPSWEVPPRDPPRSPRLEFVMTVMTQ